MRFPRIPVTFFVRVVIFSTCCAPLCVLAIFACADLTGSSRSRCSVADVVDDNGDTNITIGFLSNFKHHGGMGKLIAGAVSLAVKDVNSRTDLLPNHTLRFVVGDTERPNTPMAIRKMTEMRDSGVTAFIGPDHSCASEALVAAAWCLPMIAFVSHFYIFFFLSESYYII